MLLVPGAKQHHAALANTRNISNGFFCFIWVEIAPAANDQIFGPAGQIEITICNVTQITSVQPAAMPEQLMGGSRIAVITTGGGRPLKLHMPLTAIRQLLTRRFHDTNLITMQGLTAGYNLLDTLIINLRWQRLTPAQQSIPLHPVDNNFSTRWRKGQPHCGLCKPIHWRHAVCAKPVPGESVGKVSHRIGAYRFCAIESHAPTAQIKALNILFCNLAQAQLIGKIGSRRQGTPVVVDAP